MKTIKSVGEESREDLWRTGRCRHACMRCGKEGGMVSRRAHLGVAARCGAATAVVVAARGVAGVVGAEQLAGGGS